MTREQQPARKRDPSKPNRGVQQGRNANQKYKENRQKEQFKQKLQTESPNVPIDTSRMRFCKSCRQPFIPPEIKEGEVPNVR